MKPAPAAANPAPFFQRRLLPCCAGLLGLLLAGLFHTSFKDGHVVFANDGPLGAITAQAEHAPGGFTGFWQDLYWFGGQQPGAMPNITQLIYTVVGPGTQGREGAVTFAKFYVPLALLVLGLAAAAFARALCFCSLTVMLTALSATLSMNAFSNACWGLPTWGLVWAMTFLAVAALASHALRHPILKYVLAGFAVGFGIMEGYDVGALFSLYVAAFGVFVFAMHDKATSSAGLVKSGLLVGLMAACAAWISAQALSTLVGTQIKGIAGTSAEEKSTEERWAFATSGSLPKKEVLRVIIPGLYGYRMDTPDGGQYWGAVNRSSQIEDLVNKAMNGIGSEREQAKQVLQQVQGNPYAFRHSGSGEYAGILVVLLAIWAVVQSLRGNASSFSVAERRMVWFWTGAAIVSLLLAFGRHAPFYQFVYKLPYFSTIRNPIKFMQPFHVALIILFAHGVEDLCRKAFAKEPKHSSLLAQLRHWWAGVTGFDRKWTVGNLAALGLSVLGLLIFASSRNDLIYYLQLTGFNAEEAPAIARFATREILWFLFFFALSSFGVIALLSGALGGLRAKWGVGLLGLVLVADMSRANSPWIIYENYKAKYQSNAVIDLLRERSHEHRVAMGPNPGLPELSSFHGEVYHRLWLQHHFPYYNIQSLDIPQEPRVAQEKLDYVSAFGTNPARYWQLSNTRYVFGMLSMPTPQGAVGYVDLLNAQLDPVHRRFRVKTPFTLTQQGEHISAITNATGPYALIEFTGALPRAKLYNQWQVQTDLKGSLAILVSPQFDPDNLVLLNESGKIPPPQTNTPLNAGTVEFVGYTPKRIQLKAEANTDSVLLLNDRYHPDWKVWVDGQPAELLRANYIARAVMLPPGSHTVEFKFQPSTTPLMISLSAIAVGIFLCGFVLVQNRRQPVPATETTSSPVQPDSPASNETAGGKGTPAKRRKSK